MLVTGVGVLVSIGAASWIAGAFPSESKQTRAGVVPGSVAKAPDTPTVSADGSCPETYDPGSGWPAAAAEGPLAPADPQQAILCTYWSEQPSVPLPLAAASEAANPDDVVAYLNGLPGPPRGDTSLVDACAQMLRPEYLILLRYGADEVAVVELNPNCGSVSHAGVVRRLERLPDLLAFWQPSDQ